MRCQSHRKITRRVVLLQKISVAVLKYVHKFFGIVGNQNMPPPNTPLWHKD